MSELVTARAILWSPEGYSILDAVEPITIKNVHMYQADQATVDQASKGLEELGFTIEATAPDGLSFTGELAIFERVFQTKLQLKSKRILEANSTTADETYYQELESIQIPESLSGTVAGVVLTIPPTLFS